MDAGRGSSLSQRRILLGRLGEIGIGASRGYDPHEQGRHSIFVVRTGEHQCVAYSNSCPHRGYEGASMAWRQHQFLTGDGQHIVCGSHGALFEIESGLCVRGPCIGEQLQPVLVSCDAQGQIYLDINSEQSV